MALEFEPLVSVVTPVFNGEKYLVECIESVLAQSYHNWEYIIVNNCSTDRTLEIAESYAQKDKRLRVFNNERFVGPMENHNIVLGKIASESKYCKLLQADDWLYPDCLRLMVEVVDANPSVGIVSSYCLDGERVDCVGLPYPSTVVPGRDIARLMLLGGPQVTGSVSSILVRSDIVRSRKPFYDETHFQRSDTESCYEILQGCDFGFVHQILTFIRRHEGALSAKGWRYSLWWLVQLDLVRRFGPIYLTPKEHEKRWAEVQDLYYRMLGRSLFKLREKDFWDYHRKALSEMGLPLRRTQLVRGVLMGLARLFLGPARILRQHIQSIQKDREFFARIAQADRHLGFGLPDDFLQEAQVKEE